MPNVVTQCCLEQDLNPRPTDRKPKCLTRCTIAPRQKGDMNTDLVSVKARKMREAARALFVCSCMSCAVLLRSRASQNVRDLAV